MNAQAMLMLKFLRQVINADKGTSDFQRGYAMGQLNACKYDLEPWERQYLDVVADRIVWGGKAA